MAARLKETVLSTSRSRLAIRVVLSHPLRSKVTAPLYRHARTRPLARPLGKERTLAQVPTRSLRSRLLQPASQRLDYDRRPQVRLKSDDESAFRAAVGAIC